jgi:hypothetical protein
LRQLTAGEVLALLMRQLTSGKGEESVSLFAHCENLFLLLPQDFKLMQGNSVIHSLAGNFTD